MEDRKKKEAELQRTRRDRGLEENIAGYHRLYSYRKFYSITRKSENFLKDFIIKEYQGKKVLDYGCGDGPLSILLAKNGVDVVGIDISEDAIAVCKDSAKKEGLEGKVSFFVMDAEKTSFSDNYFDGVLCTGVLHHLDIDTALKELARILKPDGSIICNEPLSHNPAFQLYRELTPHLRSEWEMRHILSKKEINLAEKYFEKIEKRFFHLTTLLAVPFRNLPFFNFILGILEKVDSLILRLPFIKWWAWQIIFILSKPKK